MSRALPRYLDTDHAEWERKLARILIEVGEPAPASRTFRATAAGDEQRLRGIPCQAKGVGGTSPGTNPMAALMSKQKNR